MTNYQVTIGYKAIITVSVKAESEDAAKKIALEKFKSERGKAYSSRNVNLEDDNYAAYGVLDMDNTWNNI